ncbi:MAG: efflux RND transporter periplasmic adaptor subunit [Xanthomonadales bacterium]|nr:efflux RND transporter periplasmic adaptor subunit [Xanthomonadales bacterium]
MRLLKRLLPLVILVVAVILAMVLITSRPEPPRQEAAVTSPLVQVEPAQQVDARFHVRTQGTVQARTETLLVAEVSGVITQVGEAFNAGGFFRRGEVLLRIDGRDYDAALRRAEAAVANRQALLAQEQARADQALRDWENLRRPGTPSDLVLRKPYVAEAQANLRSAQADLQRARVDMDRTVIRAPYDGLMREKRVDVGQYVSTGSALAMAWATGTAEIRLPLTEHDASFVQLPAPDDDTGLAITLRARVAGQARSWPARIVRSESVIDERSRVLYAVASVEDPYNLTGGHDGGPLSFGTFVHADLPASIGAAAVTVPRLAIRAGNQVMVVDDQDRLRLRQISIVRSDASHAYIDAGLHAGERVVVSSLEAPVDGMSVRIEGEAASATAEAPAAATDDPDGSGLNPPVAAELAPAPEPIPATAPEGEPPPSAQDTDDNDDTDAASDTSQDGDTR